MERAICFITGPCAAGKSTVGKLLAQHASFDHAMFLQVDEIRRTIWRGYIPPFPDTPAAREQLDLAARSAARVAKTYYQAGFWVFLEEVLEQWLIPVYESELQEYPVNIFCLFASDEELMKRDRSRSVSEQMGPRCLELSRSMRELSQTKKWTNIDSTKETPQETTQHIVEVMATVG